MCEPALAQLLDPVQPLAQQLVQRCHGVGRPALADVEHQLLRLVDGCLHVLGHRVADVRDLPCHPDEPAQQCVLLDDLGVVARVGDRGRVGLQGDEDRWVPHLLHHPGALELVGHGHRVDRLAPLHEGPDGPEDVPVRRLVEVAGRAPLDPHRRRVVRQQHRPEQRLLRLEVVGRHARATRRMRGRSERPGADVVEGLDHGSPTLTVRSWGT